MMPTKTSCNIYTFNFDPHGRKKTVILFFQTLVLTSTARK